MNFFHRLFHNRPQLMFSELKKLARLNSPRKFYIYATFIGLVSGAIGAGFTFVLTSLESLLFVKVAGVNLGEAAGEFKLHAAMDSLTVNPYLLFSLPVLGGLVAGLIIQRFDMNAAGGGTDNMIQTYHEKNGVTHWKTPIVKFFATLATLSTGGSGGKEGPIAQIGSGFGSLFAQWSGFGPKATRSLFLSGIAGALGAVFLTPLGAAIAAVEVMYKEDFESESLVPCILASVAGYFIYTFFYGFHVVFHLPESSFSNWKELLVYSLLGVVCFVFGWIYVRLYKWVQRIGGKLSIPFFLKVGLGGVVVGAIGVVSHESLGSGLGFLQSLMDGESLLSQSPLSQLLLKDGGIDPHWMIVFLLLVASAKIVTTSFTVGSGGSGGLLVPSLFIGGTLGAAVGIFGELYLPQITESYVPYIPVGMASFFAGVANAPIASVIMVTEMTGSYVLLPPLITVAMLSMILCHKFSLYENQKLNKFESPAHVWDITSRLMKNFTIRQTIDSITKAGVITLDTSIRGILRFMSRLNRYTFPVTDSHDRFLGIVSLAGVGREQKKELLKQKLQARDILISDIPLVTEDDSLSDALEILINYDLDRLPIVDENRMLVGTIGFQDILTGYHKRLTGRDIQMIQREIQIKKT